MIFEIIVAGVLGLFGFNKLLNSKEKLEKEHQQKKLGLSKNKMKKVSWIAVIGSFAGIFKPPKKTRAEKFKEYIHDHNPFVKKKKKNWWEKLWKK